MSISIEAQVKQKQVENSSEQIKREPPVDQRLYSLDALRGFDMFWIIGAEEIFHGLAKATGSPFWAAVSTQFTHPSWNGFHLYDLIFPLFLFLAGVSTPYSIGRELDKGKSRQQLMLRVIKRGLILVLLGMFYNNGLQFRPLSDFRIMSVLGRIGIGYMLANIIYLYASERAQAIWFAGLLVGYWLILKFTSAPGFPPGDLSIEGNFASYVDRTILPGKLSRGIHDTVGFFNNIPAISTALLGILVGSFLKRKTIAPASKALWMAVAGIVFLLLAQLWNLDFPINKNMWSSSFVLHTSGLSLLLLSLFFYIIDVHGYKSWAFFFKVIGMNSILIYISGKFINWEFTTKALFQWLGQLVGDPFNVVVIAVCLVLIKWLFLYLLYKKRMFLKV